MKKFLSIILTAFLMLPLNILNFTASAAVYGEYENFSYLIENNQVTITGYNFTNNNPVELIIPSVIEGCPVTSIGQRAFAYRDNIVSIYIPESVININQSFYFCSSIESISVDQNNTKYHTINNCLIETDNKTLILGCKNSIIPTDGSVVEIGSSAYVNCEGLKTISIPNTILTIDVDAFSYCENLSSVLIPESVTDIDFGAFIHCDKLKSIEVDANNKYYHSSGNCIIRTNYKTLVAGCNNSIIPDDGSVTKIGECAFSGCKFTDFAIPNGIKEIGNYAFNACYSLERVSIPESVTIISDGAFRLTNIKRIILPKSIKEIGYQIFADNPEIKDIYYEGSEIDKENILINSDNDELLSANWHYNACSMNAHSYDNSSDTTCNLCGWIRLPEIDSLYIQDISVIEYTHGYEDGSGNYIYSFLQPSFTLTLKDGRKLSSSGGIDIDGEWYNLSIDTDNQRGEVWTAGNTYEAVGSILGVSDTFYVSITESPVESIEIKDISVIEYTHGYEDGSGNYIYGDLKLPYTVTLKDGRKLSSSGVGVDIDGEWYSFSIDTENQIGEYWTAGNTYEAVVSILGASDTFNVTITESPVERIDIEDVTLIKGVDSYNDGSYEHYNIDPTYTLTFKDGSQKTINNGKAVLFDGYYSHLDIDINQYENPLEVGNTYELTGSFGSLTDQFKVTVIDNPVTDIEIITPPQKTEYIIGEQFDLKGATLRVHFNDNTYEDINIKYNCDGLLNYGYKYYSNHLQNSYGIDYINEFAEIGKQKVAITFLGKTVQYEVNVKENLWEKIEIKNGADKSLIITAVNPDGTTLEMKVLDADFQSGGEGYFNGLIMTDKGIFGGKFYLSNGNASVELNGFTSNTLTDCEWMNLYFNMHYYKNPFSEIFGYYFQQSIRFNGKITAENIDSLILLASEYIDLPANRVSGQAIREALLKTFAVKEIDLSLSKNYDPQSDTYIWNGGIRYPDDYILPTEIKYNNGAWNIKITQSDETVVYLKLNDELKIISINYEYVPGDIDGVEGITDADAEYLLMYTFFPEDYPVNQECDFNGDGKVNDADAERLLMYTFFPEDYPLN